MLGRDTKRREQKLWGRPQPVWGCMEGWSKERGQMELVRPSYAKCCSSVTMDLNLDLGCRLVAASLSVLPESQVTWGYITALEEQGAIALWVSLNP